MAAPGVAFIDEALVALAPQASGHASSQSPPRPSGRGGFSPADSRASGRAISVRGRQIARTIAENSCRRKVKADAEDALSPGSSRDSLGQRSLTSAQGSSLIHFIYDGCEHLKCKTCGIKAGSASPTPQSDKDEYCGIVSWRSYTTFQPSSEKTELHRLQK